ncbi:MAG: ABC transporter substrate-binding protein [Ruminococcus sp.]
MKKLLSCFTSIILIILTAVSCSENTDFRGNKLTFYDLKTDVWDESYISMLREIINRYNEKDGVHNTDYEIEIVEFDSTKLMYERMSTEIMAGGGPDIFSPEYMIPYEKLLKNQVFADINAIVENDKSKDKMNFDEYNTTILNAGVLSGKRYIIPLFYRPNILLTGSKTMEKFGITKKQGTTLAYRDIENVFKEYFDDTQDYSFMFKQEQLWYGQSVLFDFIRDFIDFENGKTYFETTEFRNNLDSVKKITENSNESYFLFDDRGKDGKLLFDIFTNLNLTDAQDYGRGNRKSNSTPIIFNGFVRDKNTYSAKIECGVAINANCNKDEKVLKFLKYLLSEDTQEYFCGDKEGSSYGGSNLITLPVRKEAYMHQKHLALDIQGEYIGEIIGRDKEYNDLAKAYMNIAENINQVSIYSNFGTSYYCKNVIGDIVNDYLNSKINKKKFIQQLTNTTEMYLNE